MRGCSRVRKLVLDTGVIVEYIILKSKYRPKIVELFNLASENKIELYTSIVALSEVLYIASRIYQAANVDDPNDEAKCFIEWIKRRVKVVDVNEDIVLEAGELKKQLHIALPDCYIIATAKYIKAVPVFRKIEREMEPVLTKLREIGVLFLEGYV